MGALGEIHHTVDSLEQLAQHADSYARSLKQCMNLPPSEATVKRIVDIGTSLRAVPPAPSCSPPDHPILAELYSIGTRRITSCVSLVSGLQPLFTQALGTIVNLLATDFYRWAKSVVFNHAHREPLNTTARRYHALDSGLCLEEHHPSLFHPPIIAYAHCIDDLAQFDTASSELHPAQRRDHYWAIISRHKVQGADYFDHHELFADDNTGAINAPQSIRGDALPMILLGTKACAIEGLGVPPSARYLPLMHILRGDFGDAGSERLSEIIDTIGKPRNKEEMEFTRSMYDALEGTPEQRFFKQCL